MNCENAQLETNSGMPFASRGIKLHVLEAVAVVVLLCLVCSVGAMADDDDHFLPAQVRALSTVPGNGDVNPYGVAFVPPGFPAGGAINPGDILVSNFNASSNLQGSGTTIVDVPPAAPLFQYFGGAAPLGLTTALNVLQKGFV